MANQEDEFSKYDRRYEEEGDRRPRRRSNNSSSGSNKTTVIVVTGILSLILLSVVACCGGFVFWGYKLATPNWHPYTNAELAYNCEFPAPNKDVVTSQGTGPDQRAYTQQEAKHGFPASKFFVRTAKLTAEEAKNPGDVLQKLADAWAKQRGYTELSRDNLEDDDNSLELYLQRKPDNNVSLQFWVIEDRLYTVGIDSQIFDNSDPDIVQHFFDRFSAESKKKK
jgi:hypothetical protein